MHLLVVEDDPALAGLLGRLLVSDRHVVELASSGEAALEIVDAQPALSAIIVDVTLPGISGIEVARRLRHAGTTVPVVMLTARDTVDDRVAGLDAGADDYLVKPFAYEELAARRSWNRTRWRPSWIARRSSAPTLLPLCSTRPRPSIGSALRVSAGHSSPTTMARSRGG